MTVIEFRSRDIKINYFITGLIVSVVGCALWNIFLYNSVTTVRHNIDTAANTLEQAQVQNAELKNSLYSITDGTGQEAFLQSRGLVLDTNPQYSKTPLVVSRDAF